MLQGAAFRILACFYDSDERSFVELCEAAGYPTDLGGYYIRQLLSGEYIEKIERGTYKILPKGKQQLAFKYGKPMFAPKPRLTVLLVAKQGDSYVTLRRKVQPFMGAAEWPASEVRMGEAMQDAMVRLQAERLGCTGQATLVGFFRRTDMYEDTVFDDKLFAVHTVDLPQDAQIQHASTTGEIVLLAESELLGVANPSKSLLDIFHYGQSPGVPLAEKVYSITPADLSLQ